MLHTTSGDYWRHIRDPCRTYVSVCCRASECFRSLRSIYLFLSLYGQTSALSSVLISQRLKLIRLVFITGSYFKTVLDPTMNIPVSCCDSSQAAWQHGICVALRNGEQ
ncbi:uncharacterized protein LOC112452072 [Temnothorax curvispinosus]|uniref:Uncharacterized protein LOC112452072 n=1 Tax=Temnothorax curvispinosus TaxID=300111 RepID=A0A6J1PEK5_9HYME|nr:uncharacterized protein LOC112452072 [Temnothorax curvispinosus]